MYRKLRNNSGFTAICFLLVFVLLQYGCQSIDKIEEDVVLEDNLTVQEVYSLPYDGLMTGFLLNQLEAYGRFTKSNHRVIVTTFMDIGNLSKTTMFGQIIAEQVLSGLHMRGYRVVEVRHTKVIKLIKEVGELFLTRDSSIPGNAERFVLPMKFKEDYINDYILVGTYQVTRCCVYVNARIIDPAMSEVVSVSSYKLQRTHNINELLSTTSEVVITRPPKPMPKIGVRQIK